MHCSSRWQDQILTDIVCNHWESVASGVWLDFELGPNFPTVLLKSTCPVDLPCTLQCILGLICCTCGFQSSCLGKHGHGLLVVHELQSGTCGSLPFPAMLLAIGKVATTHAILRLVLGGNLTRGVQQLQPLLLCCKPTMPMPLYGCTCALQIVPCRWANHAPSASLVAMLQTKNGGFQ